MRSPFTKETTPFRSDLLTFEYDVKAIKEDGSFKGYGSTFDQKPDAHGHIIMSGAFQKSLRRGGRNRTGVMMLRSHNPDRIPGIWTDLHEDHKGLYNEGQLFVGSNDATELGRETHALLRHKAIQHESIGYDLPRDKSGAVKPSAYERDEKKGWTYLKEIELYEISLVAFPANVNARVTRVKDMLMQAETAREFENALRESGLSKSVAQYITKLVRPSLRDVGTGAGEQDKGGDTAAIVLQALRGVSENL